MTSRVPSGGYMIDDIQINGESLIVRSGRLVSSGPKAWSIDAEIYGPVNYSGEVDVIARTPEAVTFRGRGRIEKAEAKVGGPLSLRITGISQLLSDWIDGTE